MKFKYFLETRILPETFGGSDRERRERQKSRIRSRLFETQLQTQVVFQKRRKYIWVPQKIIVTVNLYPLMLIKLQELFTGSKYKFKNENDVYQLIISNPKVEDSGKFTIEIAGISSTAFLNVDGAFKVLIFCFNHLVA